MKPRFNIPKKRESTVERDCAKLAEKHGCLAYKFVSPGNKGVPDRLFIGPKGNTFYIEFKRPNEKPEPIQEYQIDRIRAQGAHCYVCDCYDHFVDILAHELMGPPNVF